MKKGNINISLVMGIFLICSIVISITAYPVLNTYNNINIYLESQKKDTYVKNGLERLYSVFYQNPSHKTDINYNDIFQDYKIIEDTSSFDSFTTSSTTNKLEFEIDNATEISLDLITTETNLDPYDIELLLNGRTIFQQTALIGNNTITIPYNYVYDESSNTYNYGNYILNVYASEEIECKISYQKLNTRELKILENDLINRTFIFKREDSKIKLYFK